MNRTTKESILENLLTGRQYYRIKYDALTIDLNESLAVSGHNMGRCNLIKEKRRGLLDDVMSLIAYSLDHLEGGDE